MNTLAFSPAEIKSRMAQLHIRPDKFLGQHFLIDDDVLTTIMDQAELIVMPKDTIVEIGSGFGALTNQLLGFPNQVLAIEKDPVLARSLSEAMGDPAHLTVKEGDALDILARPTWTQPFVVVANIPYGITSPILRTLITGTNRPHSAVLMMQKEVAERIMAKPGNRDRGLLTVLVEIAAEVKLIREVPPTSFWPEPEVDSAIVALKLRPEPLIPLELVPEVMPVVIAGFSAKRRQIHNSLVNGLAVTSEASKKALAAAGIDEMRRAETITIDEWVNLAKALKSARE